MADDTVQPPSEPTPEPAPEPKAEPGAEPTAEQAAPAIPAEDAAAPAGAEVQAEPDVPPQQDSTPAIAATLEVPPLDGSQPPVSPAGEGGEWDLLLSKLNAFLASGQLQQIWQQTRSPLTALAALVGLVLLLRLYGALLGAIEGLPLVPGLLELVGLIWLLRHGAPRLVRSEARRELISGLQRRWQAFRGRG